MVTGEDLIKQSIKTIGCPYVLGANVPMDDPNYRGAFDCAEKSTFDARWVTGKLYGCVDNTNWSDPEPYTSGWWQDCLRGTVKVISVRMAMITGGAFILRKGAGARYGHIVMALGDGDGSIEAMDRKHGVCYGSLANRRWDVGILLPDVEYKTQGQAPVIVTPAIYRLTHPYMRDPMIVTIQSALGITVDGIYGPLTRNAVARFQEDHGLVVDGEAGPQTIKELIGG